MFPLWALFFQTPFNRNCIWARGSRTTEATFLAFLTETVSRARACKRRGRSDAKNCLTRCGRINRPPCASVPRATRTLRFARARGLSAARLSTCSFSLSDASAIFPLVTAVGVEWGRLGLLGGFVLALCDSKHSLE